MTEIQRRVSALCVAPRSIYHTLDDVEAYCHKRDARTFQGDTPIVAHPPCRAWSAKTKQQAKPEPGEKELGLWCVEQLRECGGVLEQPAFSELFSAAGLPLPGFTRSFALGEVWTLQVWQSWWGYPMKKTTWLAFAGIHPDDIEVPFRLHPLGQDQRKEQLMSRNQRSQTTREFAEWLVAAARLVK